MAADLCDPLKQQSLEDLSSLLDLLCCQVKERVYLRLLTVILSSLIASTGEELWHFAQFISSNVTPIGFR